MSYETVEKKSANAKSKEIDFMGLWPIATTFSLLLVLASIFIWFQKGEGRFGVDFTGGHEVVIKLSDSTKNADDVRKSLNEAGFTDPLVQSFESGTGEYTIRFSTEDNALSSEALVRKVTESTVKTLGVVEVLKNDYVGPTIGKELRSKALIGLGVALLAILIFVSVRFEPSFAVGAVVAVLHDVIVATGVYLLAGFTLSTGAMAAALTIVGYSVNDTVVIFDRVREEASKSKNYNLVSLFNHCMNAMLSRTIITSLLTLLSVIALYIFGGGAISDMSFFLLIGLISGSYSTIYIASPVVLAWHKFRGGSVDQ